MLDFDQSPCCSCARLDELRDTRHRLGKLILQNPYISCGDSCNTGHQASDKISFLHQILSLLRFSKPHTIFHAAI